MSTASVESTGTLSEISRASAHADLQPITAEYYNLTDAEGNPIASLLVLMDRWQNPVRAEVHVYSPEPSEQDVALRQARLLLEDRYYSPEPIPLFVLYAAMIRDRIQVSLENGPQPRSRGLNLRPILAGVAILVLLLLAAWYIAGRFQDGSQQTAFPQAPAAVQTEAEPALGGASGNGGTGSTGQPVNAQGDALPPSRNAHPGLAVGVRARIQPGLASALRTEPGANAGEIIDYIQNGAEMTIIDGPVMQRGESDTIVWWKVRLDDGREGWTPANTSETRVLAPVE